MLTELHIQDFAIIDRLDLEFGSGLATFTGETGAGKSIIIDAVETLLGGRAETTMVRTGADRAIIEGAFRIPDANRKEIHEILKREELLDEPDYLVMGREIRDAGRNIARVNGRIANAGLLRELGEYLVDVHGQSEHLSLLRVNQHLGLLDRYALTADGGDKLADLLSSYQEIFHQLQEIDRELDEIRAAERDAARRTEMLAFQVQEITSANLRSGEEEDLVEERDRLANAEGLVTLAQEALQALDEGSPETPAATDLVGQVTEALSRLARLDKSQADLHEKSSTIFEGLSELGTILRQYLENIEFNPRRLDRVEERLALIQILKRKYGGSIPSVLEFAAKAQSQLDQITHAAERQAELEAEREILFVKLAENGLALSKMRREAAKNLQAAIEAELEDLHMSGSRFMVDFRFQPDPRGIPLDQDNRVAYGPIGLERVEFLIAPNLGEGFKPLAKIASGGETSRLMLALKNVLAKADHVPTLIFDEIDQGIGGRVGAVVGQKLWQLGGQHQVLCITHLPQLAAYAGQHYHVEKHVQGNRTTTRVQTLEGPDRLTELAQMLGGVSQGTLQSASELLQSAQKQTADW